MSSSMTYQQALDGLRIFGGLCDPEVTRLIDELDTRGKRLGENHPDVADALKRIVQRCRYLGKNEQAVALGIRALVIFETVHGKNHLDVAEQLKYLGSSCRRQGKYEEAESYCRRAIAIFETELAPDNLEIAQVKESLGLCYSQQGKYKEADELFKRALEIYELKLGPNYFSVISMKSKRDFCKKSIEAEELEKRKQITARKRTSDAVNANGNFTYSYVRHGATKKAKYTSYKVDPPASPSATLAVASTAMPSSSFDEVVPNESLPLIERVVANARAKIMTEIDGIAEMNKHSHLNLKQTFEKSQAEKVDKNENVCIASQTIEGSKSSQSGYEQLIAGLAIKLNETAEQLSSSEEKIKNLERSHQATTAKLKAEGNDKARRLSEAKESIKNFQSTFERTIAKLKAEIAEKSIKLAEAQQTIESRLSCSVCMEENISRMWTECRHVATCEQCATKLLRSDMGNSGDGVACPICQTLGFPTKVYI